MVTFPYCLYVKKKPNICSWQFSVAYFELIRIEMCLSIVLPSLPQFWHFI